MPLIIFPATVSPSPPVVPLCTVDIDHARSAATMSATRIFAYHVFGSCSYILSISFFILPCPLLGKLLTNIMAECLDHEHRSE